MGTLSHARLKQELIPGCGVQLAEGRLLGAESLVNVSGINEDSSNATVVRQAADRQLVEIADEGFRNDDPDCDWCGHERCLLIGG